MPFEKEGEAFKEHFMDVLFDVYSLSRSICLDLDRYETTRRENVAKDGPFLEDLCDLSISRNIGATRRCLVKTLQTIPEEMLGDILIIDPLFEALNRLRGTLYGTELEPAEAQKVEESLGGIEDMKLSLLVRFHLYLIGSLYQQPFSLPFPKDFIGLPLNFLARFLQVLCRQPHLMTAADGDAFASFYKEMTDWMFQGLLVFQTEDPDRADIIRSSIKKYVTFGAAYYLDKPIKDLVLCRARLIDAVLSSAEKESVAASFARISQSRETHEKVRLGIISRNLGDYTDTRALYAMFHAFDPERYEIYWYSLDIQDPTTRTDIGFMRRMAGLVHKAVSLRGNSVQMARLIQEDELDILAVGTAYSFAVKDLDILLYHKLATIQLSLSELVAGSSGFPSFDYLFVPASTQAISRGYEIESSEQLISVEGPVLWYEKKPQVKPDSRLTREALGVPDEAIVYCSGAAANKQMEGTLVAFARIIQAVPNSYLLLYPFNPAWGGYYIGLTFMARLRAVLKRFPAVDSRRIRVVREVSPDDGDRLIQLSDIYLGSFPRAGATSAMLALRYGKPVVARQEGLLHSHDDATLLRSIRASGLIGANEVDYVNLAVRLGREASFRESWKAHIKASLDTAPFFAIEERSRHFQRYFDSLRRSWAVS
jgi:predicted O-linked N-acetylglucosamine transferase (SPINDLY family)